MFRVTSSKIAMSTAIGRTALRAALAVGILAVATGMAHAQSDNARISGTVADASGAAIPGATVTVKNTGTNAIQTVTSGANGDFTVSALPTGNYHVTVTMTGFATQEQNLHLDVSQVQAENFKLAAGGANTVVDVTDAAPVVELANSDTSEVITGRELTDLPLNGRNFTQLALLQPGVTRGQSNSSASGYNKGSQPVETIRFNETGGAAVSANGLRPQANNFILDGIDNNESLVNTIVVFPNVEALSEFRVTNSLAPAELGRAGGAIIQAAVKSGTNQIHGSAFIFYRDSALGSANGNYEFTGGFTPIKSFHRNLFGATLGGPIWKDRIFAFADYSGLRSNIPNSSLTQNTVPTPKMRTGDFSDLLGSSQTVVPALYSGPGSYSPDGCATFTTVHGIVLSAASPNGANNALNASVDNGAIFDPLTCRQFGTVTAPNVIPTNRLNPVAMKYLNAFPAQNRPATNNVINNYQNQQVAQNGDNQFDARLDFHISSKDNAFVRGTTDNYNNVLTTSLVGLPSGFGSGNNDTHPRELAAGYTHIFTPRLVNEFRFGYLRPYYSYLNPDNGIALDTQLGIPNGNRNSLLGGISLIGGGNTELSYTGDGGPYSVPQYSYQYNDSVTLVRGAHNFRFGANIIHREVDFFQAQYNAKGFFSIYAGAFTGYETSEIAGAFVNDYNISNPTGYYKTISWETGYFAQDDWKVNPRLTLNLGVRYDLYTHPYEQNNRQSNYNIATNTLQEAGVNGASRSLINTNFNNFAPRIGFAYDLFGDGKTALRGGYGIYYFLDRGGVGNQLSNNPDFNGSADYSSYSGYRIDLSGQAPMIANSSNNTNTPGPYTGNNSTLATGALPNATPSVNINSPANSVLIAYPVNDPTSMIQQYNLSIERALGSKTSVTIAYVGTKSDHLFNSINYSAHQLGTGVYFGQAQGNSITLNEDNGTSHYSGLQSKIDRKLAEGLQFTATYTWSHAMDNSVGPFSQTGASTVPTTAAGPQFNLNRGDSDDDIRNVATFAMLGELPFGRGKKFASHVNHAVNYFIGGWQISPFLQLSSGSPFDISVGASGSGPSVRPNLINRGSLFLHPSVNNQFQVLNAADFAAPAVNPATQAYLTVGNVHKNQFRGSNYSNLSMSIFKDIPFTDRIVGQIRGQFYNVFNSPAFAPPSNTSLPANWTGTAGAGQTPPTFANLTNTDYFSQRLTELSFRIQF